MTVSTIENRNFFVGNGVTTAFATPFFLDNDDVVVLLVEDATGDETPQILDTDYSLTGAANPSGGTVTFDTAPASGFTIVIYVDPALTQEVLLIENDPLPVKSGVERPLDKLTLIAQRDRSLLQRSLRLPDGDTEFVAGDMDLPPKAQRASQFLAFDADGKPVAQAGTTDVPVSAFMENVVAAVDAAAVRTLLEGTPVGQALFTAASALAARGTLGATVIGEALFTAASALAARNTLGATAIGNALFLAVSAAAARGTLELGTIATQDATAVSISGGTVNATVLQEGGDNAITATPLASTTNGQGASLVGIEDAASNFAATDVEGALAELVAFHATLGTIATQDADDVSISGGTVNATVLQEGGDNAITAAPLASTANGQGASLVGVEDAAGNFAATDVEGALAELAGSGLDKATPAEMEAETADKYPDAALVKYSPGVARAWVNFDGTGVVSIRRDYNVSSITDNGTGDYTVNFASALPDSNYSTQCTGQRDTDLGAIFACISSSNIASASSVRVVAKADSGGAVDIPTYCVSVNR